MDTMRSFKFACLFAAMIVAGLYACKSKTNNNTTTEETPGTKASTANPLIFKGLYSLSPTMKMFKSCATGHEYFVADSSKELELKYWQMVPAETADEPLYIEAEGQVVKSNSNDNGGHD